MIVEWSANHICCERSELTFLVVRSVTLSVWLAAGRWHVQVWPDVPAQREAVLVPWASNVAREVVPRKNFCVLRYVDARFCA